MNSLPDQGPARPARTPRGPVRRLGDPIATFQPGLENLAAGIVIGSLMAAAGGALAALSLREAIVNGHRLPWRAEEGSSLFAVFGMAAIGLALAGAGVALVAWVRGLFSSRVLVCPAGLVCVDRCGVRVFPWDRIERVQETVTREYFPLEGVFKYAVPMGESRSFVVRRRDGVEFRFDGNRVKRLNALARMIGEATCRRAIPWDLVEK